MKKKKGRKLKKFFKVLFILIFLFTIIYLILNFCDTRIKNILINGNNYITDQEIIEIAKLENYPDFFTTSSLSVRKKILKDKRIKQVNVKKELFGKIYIEVKEKKMLFIYDNKIILEDKSEIANIKNVKLPTLINYTVDVKYDDFIKKMNKIDDTVLEKISEIKYDPNEYDEDRFLLYMNDSNLVYVTLTKLEYLNKYNDYVKKLEGKTGTLYLDSGNYFEIKK